MKFINYEVGGCIWHSVMSEKFAGEAGMLYSNSLAGNLRPIEQKKQHPNLIFPSHVWHNFKPVIGTKQQQISATRVVNVRFEKFQALVTMPRGDDPLAEDLLTLGLRPVVPMSKSKLASPVTGLILDTEFVPARKRRDNGSVDEAAAILPCREDRVGECAIARLSKDAFCGLKTLHSMRILHEDIKPGNMLITKTNMPAAAAGGSVSKVVPRVKLIDVGLTDLRNSRRKRGIGTRFMWPPELAPQTLNNHPNHGRLMPNNVESDDVWALGLSLLWVALGAHPFLTRQPTVKCKKQIYVYHEYHHFFYMRMRNKGFLL